MRACRDTKCLSANKHTDQSRVSLNYDESEERTMLDLNDQYDPDELAYQMTLLPYQPVRRLEEQNRLNMQEDEGPLGHIYRHLLSGSSTLLERGHFIV